MLKIKVAISRTAKMPAARKKGLKPSASSEKPLLFSTDDSEALTGIFMWHILCPYPLANQLSD
jgi:hypothetical protein